MHTKRTITASLAAILGAAALAGPAAAVPADSHHQTTITGSRSDELSGKSAPKADVYVPPASTWQGTVPPAVPSSPANPHPTRGHVAATHTSSTGFDWGSAGIGAAAGIGAFLIALGGAVGVRRRRRVQATA